MKIMVIGSSGQLGFDLMRVLSARGHEAVGLAGRAELDICDAPAFTRMLAEQRPDAVINTAAFHNVDLCETEPDAAYRTNVVAVRAMAQACEAAGGRAGRGGGGVLFVQIGTDYVVEGAPACRPVPETGPVHPKSIYALTRFGGDMMTLTHAPTVGYVVRTCGLFGIAGCKLKGGLNFVDTMIAAARAGKALKVVHDQTVAPTPTDDLAQQIVTMLERRVPPGLYHAVSHGQCTWYEFAKRALKLARIEHSLTPVTGDQWPTPAQRPSYSVLDNARLRQLGLDLMTDWQDSLERYVRAKYPRSGT